ncbi:MAG TPA: hypothetical protein VKR30_06785 [Candidatus Limnocylindrales bacterium]|nr:hypothetical protein [Candidatus Limnocylindrales bacterium]
MVDEEGASARSRQIGAVVQVLVRIGLLVLLWLVVTLAATLLATPGT